MFTMSIHNTHAHTSVYAIIACVCHGDATTPRTTETRARRCGRRARASPRRCSARATPRQRQARPENTQTHAQARTLTHTNTHVQLAQATHTDRAAHYWNRKHYRAVSSNLCASDPVVSLCVRARTLCMPQFRVEALILLCVLLSREIPPTLLSSWDCFCCVYVPFHVLITHPEDCA